jgi:hypothetical protein
MDRHAKVWISMSQRPSINPEANRTSNPIASRETSSMSAFVIWAVIPWGGRGPVTTRPRIISAYSSTCSDMASASSTSMPRYRTVLSSFVCPRSSCTALKFPVFLYICAAFVRRIECVP